MARRKERRRVRSRSDVLVREVVAAAVPAEDRARYMPFAKELYATLRRKPQAGGRRPDKPEIRNQKPELRMAERRPPRTPRVWLVPDFDRRTKVVVMRWFRRGLHGNLLWRIGVGLLARLYPNAARKVTD